MTSLLSTLLGGIVIIVVLFALLLRILRIEVKALAALLAILVLGIYVPLAIVFWPGADVFAIHLALYLVTVYVLGIIFAQRAKHIAAEKGWFHWGPASIVGFFLLIVAVDAILIMVAQKGLESGTALHFLPEPRSGGKVSSFFPGTVSHDFREKEEMFNRYIEERTVQQLRNWQIRKGWLETPRVGQTAVFQIGVSDQQGRAVTGASIEGIFMRPSDSRLDQTFHMQETEAGLYRVELTLPEPGHWGLVLNIVKGEATHEIRAQTEVLDDKTGP